MTVSVTVANSVPAGSLGAAFSSFSASGLFTLTGVEDTLTAHAGGTQAAALALSATKNYHRISVCATAGDSVALPAATVGQAHFVRNDGAASCQVFGTTPDTIDGVATATGVALPAGVGRWFICTTAAKWTTDHSAREAAGLGVGNAAPGAGGIAFPAVAVAVADANTLDDYEEDVFVPTAIFSVSNGDLAYAIQVGTYTKIGRLVTIQIALRFTETTANGTLTIGGLPFPASSTANQRYGGAFHADALSGVAGALTWFLNSGASAINLFYDGTGTATPLDNTNTAAASEFYLSFSYFI